MSHNQTELLKKSLAERILILDGAMGTMIQKYKLTEADFRGERFKESAVDLRGNNDLLTLTQPLLISAIHEKYLQAGADIIETNTFSSTTIAQADYDLQSIAYELNFAGAKLARLAADKYSTPEKPRFVAGVLGPTNRTASISPDVNDPGFRNVTFMELVDAYAQATKGLIEGGADLIMIETIFDTLHAKAAIFAIETVFEELGVELPIMILYLPARWHLDGGNAHSDHHTDTEKEKLKLKIKYPRRPSRSSLSPAQLHRCSAAQRPRPSGECHPKIFW